MQTLKNAAERSPSVSFILKLSAVLMILLLMVLWWGCSRRTAYWSVEVGPADGGKFRGIAAGDFNGDGNVDLAGGNISPGGIRIYCGRGDGTWYYSNPAAELGSFRSMESADFNCDGFDDIVASSWADLKGIHVYYSDGKSGWYEKIPPTEKDSFEGVAVADFNNDGFWDIVAANSTSLREGGVELWFGNGAGDWTEAYGPRDSDIFKDVTAADFNQDGFMDIAATAWGLHGRIHVWYGNGRGDWRKADSPVENASFWGIAAADFNGDGYPDIAAGTYLEGLGVWYGGPVSGFRQWEHVKKESSIWGVVAEDFNGDGWVDIAASSFDNDGIIILYNRQGKGWDDMSYLIKYKHRYFGLTTADINHDGLPDLAAAHPGEGLHVWVQGYGFKPRMEALEVESVNLFDVKSEKIVENDKIFQVYFDVGISDIREDQTAVFGDIVNLLREYPESHIAIEGFADMRDITNIEFTNNMELSDGRANNVKQAILDSLTNIDESIITVGFGDIFASQQDTLLMWADRRVDIVITPIRCQPNYIMKERDRNKLRLSDDFVRAQIESLAVEVVENNVFTTVNGIPDYRVGSRDILTITFWEGRSKKEYRCVVQSDGTIDLAYLPNLNVGGLTPNQIRLLITDKIKEYIRDPSVTVEILEYNARKASLLGEVRDVQRMDTGPGLYPLKGKIRIVEFLSAHGGATQNADLSKVQVVRANGQTIYLNLFAAMFEADVRQNIVLDDGDMVFIPSHEVSSQRFYILGEVHKPGIYELLGQVNVLTALMMAGSYTDRAELSSIVIIRGDITKPEVIFSNVSDIIKKGNHSENFEIFDGDIIYVSRNFIGDINYVMSQILPSLNTLFLIDRLSP